MEIFVLMPLLDCHLPLNYVHGLKYGESVGYED